MLTFPQGRLESYARRNFDLDDLQEFHPINYMASEPSLGPILYGLIDSRLVYWEQLDDRVCDGHHVLYLGQES